MTLFSRDRDLSGADMAPARWECGICWNVYDPQAGDALTQTPPGTPFELLPENWCCPNCEAPKHKFMMVTDE